MGIRGECPRRLIASAQDLTLRVFVFEPSGPEEVDFHWSFVLGCGAPVGTVAFLVYVYDGPFRLVQLPLFGGKFLSDVADYTAMCVQIQLAEL